MAEKQIGVVALVLLSVACARAPRAPVDLGGAAGAVGVGSIVVRVAGLESIEGAVAFALFDEESGFENGESPVRRGIVTVTAPDCAWEVEAPWGDYALKVYHDVNGNGRLDFNKVGIPREPYGFSNDARGRFGPPSFQAARFTLRDSRLVIDVEVRRGGSVN